MESKLAVREDCRSETARVLPFPANYRVRLIVSERDGARPLFVKQNRKAKDFRTNRAYFALE